MDAKEKIAVVGITVALVTGWKSELTPFVVDFWNGLTPWRFMFIISVGYLVWWWIDRSRLKRNLWLRESKSLIDSVVSDHRCILATDRADWARQLREMIEDAVQYKANLVTVKAEAEARTAADSEIQQQLEEIKRRLPPIVVS